MLCRTLRPLRACQSSLVPLSTRLIHPICIRSLATSSIPTTEEDPLRSSEPPTISNPSEPNPQSQLPYFVGRNNLNNLGVYHKKKRGGNMKITLLKKGEGNLQALKHDIKDALQLPDGDISVNNVTRHIQIRGHKKDQVLTFLSTMGF